MAFTPETEKIRERVKEFLGPQPGLDIGCGIALITENAIGVDIEGGKKAVIIGDAGRLNDLIPKDRKYPWIFSSHLLEHIPKPPAEVVKTWLNFIEPKGYLVLYLPDVEYYTEKNPLHLHNLTGKQWYEELKVENIILYEKRNPDTGHKEEYSVLIVIQKRR